ncbi:hypothetical protein EKD04_009635 [Chloroflexales bacterium ZM16-3]|nr:hypothetical protein [Chloroflexales bacterium ZM16-3]
MSRILSLVLAERTYEVPMAPIQRAKAWRTQLKKPLADLMTLVSTDLTVELNSVKDLITLGEKLIPVLMDAPEIMFNLLLAYAPALKAEQAYLEANAYDDELVTAFLTVLKAAFPLDRLTSLLGPASPPTSTSSPEPSGV